MEASLLPPTTDAEIDAAFAAIGYPVSNDVRTLYRMTGGFAGGAMGDDLWALWPLSQFLEENKRAESPFLWFADWLISSHLYCFCFEDIRISTVYIDHCGSHPPVLVAESVADFLQKLMSSPHEVEVF